MFSLKNSLFLGVIATTLLGCDAGTYTPQNKCEQYVGKSFVSSYTVPVQTRLTPYVSNQAQRTVGYIFNQGNKYNLKVNSLNAIEEEIKQEEKNLVGIESMPVRDSLEARIDSLEFQEQLREDALDSILDNASYGAVTLPANNNLKGAITLEEYEGDKGAVECDVYNRKNTLVQYPHK